MISDTLPNCTNKHTNRMSDSLVYKHTQCADLWFLDSVAVVANLHAGRSRRSGALAILKQKTDRRLILFIVKLRLEVAA